jgi:hypothetical protein
MAGPAAPTVRSLVPGALGGSYPVYANQIPVMMGDTIWQWHKDEFPFLSMIQKINRKPMPGWTGYHLEDQRLPRWVKYTGADETAGSEAETLTGAITGWNRLTVYDLLFNTRTTETMMVTTAGTANPIVVRGDLIGSIVAPMKNGDYLLKYSNQFPEGATAPLASWTLKNRIPWYAGTWEHSAEATWEVQAIEMYGPSGAGGKDELLYQTAKKQHEHKECMNFHLFLGSTTGGDFTSALSSTYGHPISMGLMGNTTTFIKNMNGNMTWDALKNFCQGPLHYMAAGATPLLVTSQKVIDIITSYGGNAVRITPDQKIWGWQFDGIKVGTKTLYLSHEKWLDENSELEGMGFLAAPQHWDWHPVVGNKMNLDTKLYTDVYKDNNRRITKNVFATSGGFEGFVEPATGWFYGA